MAAPHTRASINVEDVEALAALAALADLREPPSDLIRDQAGRPRCARPLHKIAERLADQVSL